MDLHTILGLIARHALTALAGVLVAHGYLQSSATEQFISACLLVIGVGWSWWQKTGQAQVAAELANMRTLPPGPPGTSSRGSSRGPTPQISQIPPKAVIAILVIGLAALALGSAQPASAQARKPALTGDPVRDIGNAVNQGNGQRAAPQGNPLDELAAKIKKLSLDDFKYAAALAHATGNTVTATCWDEWVKLLTAQQQPLNGPDGQPLKEPDPHLATDIERLSEMVAQMQPRSELSIACAPMATTAQKDAATLIGAVLSGGALGLFKLPFAIP
jgi:hypothetical protein